MSPRKAKPLALRVSQLSSGGELGFEVTVKRSPRRRTLEIIVRDGCVQLMLPSFVSDAEGMRFLERKRPWILSVIEKHQRRAEEITTKQYCQGEEFVFLGRPYRLEIKSAPQTRVQLDGETLLLSLSTRSQGSRAETVQRALQQWYRQQAMIILGEKTHALAQSIGKRCTGIRLRRTKTKWGHCTSAGVIQYNWMIMAAPEPVIDYLVAHEVSHLLHPNHSRKFWQQVEKLCPDYKLHRHWLKTRGHTLVI